MVSLLTDASSEMIYPLLPLFLTGTLGAGPAALGAIEGAAETTAALLKLASGWWSDRVPRRKPLVLAGYGLSSLMRPLIALAQGAGQVLAVRVADRVGKGIRGAPRDALIADAADVSQRGRAFGFHRAMDHAGAVIGPLMAFALLQWVHLDLRTVFAWAIVPGIASVLVLALGVRERERVAPPPAAPSARLGVAGALPATYWRYLAVLVLFTLGNSSDAFLLLRAHDLGVPSASIPLLWAFHHVVKSTLATPGGALSDRMGRRPVIIAGWGLFAAVYVAFGLATQAWHMWALFVAYAGYFALVEGTEKALVADLVPATVRGTAYGWYNLAIGVAALPASLLFGAVWQRFGATTAFGAGAALALAAAAGLTAFVRVPLQAV
jgi:MFS family permease